MSKYLNTVRDIVVILVVVWLAVGVTRWLTAPGVSPKQAQTIDSLRVENRLLDSTATILAQKADSIQRASRAKIRRDSTRAAHQLDSLQATIPDTATLIPRPVHEAIVAVKDRQIDSLRAVFFVADSGWRGSEARLVEFRVQNAALLAQVNSLESKANPGLFRRLKYAAPFVAGIFGACKLNALDCT